MTMLAFIDGSLKAATAVPEINLPCQPALGKKPQRAVYGGKSYSRILLSDHSVQFIG